MVMQSIVNSTKPFIRASYLIVSTKRFCIYWNKAQIMLGGPPLFPSIRKTVLNRDFRTSEMHMKPQMKNWTFPSSPPPRKEEPRSFLVLGALSAVKLVSNPPSGSEGLWELASSGTQC